MKSTSEELQELKQELLVLQKRIELVEEKVKLNNMRTKEVNIDWNEGFIKAKNSKPLTTTPSGDTIYFDNMNRSSYSDIN